jgi:peptide/nickel transport system permease protein
MGRLLLKRFLASLLLILAVTFVTNAILVLSPGSYIDTLRGQRLSEEYIEQLAAKHHLNSENILERYWFWLSPAIKGDFGYSFSNKVGVWELITERTSYTLLLTGSAMILSWLLAIPLGVLAGFYRNRWIDRLCSVISFAGLSIPAVFFALLLVVFAAKTGLFPVGGVHDQVNWSQMNGWEKLVDVMHHLILPMMVIATISIAQYMRQMRSEMVETLSQDYIRTARAKGLSWSRVIVRHALGNAINPLITLFGFSLSSLLAGAVLTENVFAWPGLGTLIIQAVLTKDQPVVMATATMLVLSLAVGNLIADLLLAANDPRVRVT